MANYYQKAINAVFYANPVKLQQLIDEGHFYDRLLEDTGLLSKPFPIWRITQCWLEAIGDNIKDFAEEDRVEISAFIERCNKIKEIFHTTFNVEFTPIDYHAYSDNFYAAYPEDTDADIVDDETPETLAKYGTTQLDLDLYCAVERFDIPLVILLLQKGANPRAPIARDGSENAFSRIGAECSFLCTCRLSHAWSAERKYDGVSVDDARDLMGWAAHETMFRTLEKYNTVPVEPEVEPTYPEGVHEANAKIWCIYDAGDDSTVLIVDGSHAWFMAIPESESDFRRYTFAVTGLEKDFMKEFGATTHDGLIDAMMLELDCPSSVGVMLSHVQGKKEFTVWDFRSFANSKPLEKKLSEISWTDFGTSREYAMKWYYEVARYLKLAGLSDEEVIAKFEAKPIPVLWFRNHGDGVTPESLAQKYLISEE